MDPDETLAAMREASQRIRERYAEVNRAEEAGEYVSYPDLDEHNSYDRELIQELAEALDDWLSKGGYLPAAWKQNRT